mmetsp:Transcript_5433/g.10939  ORF Transcript_5433/g.10939 Transcript_5433/m.10939 type:complete len:389 (+) Transcript_5433:837-2003(+)
MLFRASGSEYRLTLKYLEMIAAPQPAVFSHNCLQPSTDSSWYCTLSGSTSNRWNGNDVRAAGLRTNAPPPHTESGLTSHAFGEGMLAMRLDCGGGLRYTISPVTYPARLMGVLSKFPVFLPNSTFPFNRVRSLTSIKSPVNAKTSGKFPVVITTPLTAGSCNSALMPPTISKPIVVVENPSSPTPRGCEALNLIVSSAIPSRLSWDIPFTPATIPPCKYESAMTSKLVIAPDCAVTASKFPVVMIVPSAAGTVISFTYSPLSASAGSNSNMVVEVLTWNDNWPGLPLCDTRPLWGVAYSLLDGTGGRKKPLVEMSLPNFKLPLTCTSPSTPKPDILPESMVMSSRFAVERRMPSAELGTSNVLFTCVEPFWRRSSEWSLLKAIVVVVL